MLQNAAAPNRCYLGKDGAYVSPDSAEASSVFGEEVIRLTNTERNKNGLPVLHVNTTLMEIANTRAEELKTVFSHTRPDGSDWFVLYDIYEYPFEIHEGENIAKGFLNPEEVVRAWMNSEEHRDNILHTNIKEIGAAFTRKDGVDYWVECFG